VRGTPAPPLARGLARLCGCAACTLHPCDGAARQAAGVLLLAAAVLD